MYIPLKLSGVCTLVFESVSGRACVCLCCRVISRAPGLKLVVETLITSLRPIGNIVLICCAFFIVFGILGVQVNTCTGYSLLINCPLKIKRRVLRLFNEGHQICDLFVTQLNVAKRAKLVMFSAARRH